MNRRELLKRIAAGVVAIQTVDPKLLKAAFTEVNPVVEIHREGKIVAMDFYSNILREYYLPAVEEMLNADSVFLGTDVRVPLHFLGDHDYGMAVIHLDD